MKRNQNLHPDLLDADKLRKLRKEYTLQEIGDMLCVSKNVVNYRCGILGIRGNPHRRQRVATVRFLQKSTDEPPAILQNKTWLLSAAVHSTVEQIAHTLSCPPALVREALQKIV
jgi:hypothetical protein